MKLKKLINWILEWFKKPTTKPPKIARLGWKRDLPDARDIKFKVTAPVPLPPMVDLRQSCPPVYDQGQLGSCTANAMGAAFQFEQLRQQKVDTFMPSRLFIYYNTRALEGTINVDAGATLRNTMKTMVEIGVCPEKMWGYSRNFKKRPKEGCYIDAKENQVLEYLSVNRSIYDIKQCLAQGHTVAFGIMLYDSFMSEEVARTGIIPMPKPQEGSVGGHAVLAVGYDDSKNVLIMRNSWGTSWGDRGYFYLPYDYINPSLSADFWTIRLVE